MDIRTTKLFIECTYSERKHSILQVSGEKSLILFFSGTLETQLFGTPPQRAQYVRNGVQRAWTVTVAHNSFPDGYQDH